MALPKAKLPSSGLKKMPKRRDGPIWSRTEYEERQWQFGREGASEIAEVRRRVIEIRDRELQKKEQEEKENRRKQEAIENEGSVRQMLHRAKLEAGSSEAMQDWKQQKQHQNEKNRIKEDIVRKVKADAIRMKEQLDAERREKQRLHKANRLRTEAQRLAIEEERLAELRRRQAQAAQQQVLPGLGPVNTYSVSYIRQRSKLRRVGDNLDAFYDQEEKDLVKEAEQKYRRVEKKKAKIRAHKKEQNRVYIRAEQKRTRRKNGGRSPKKGALIGSASAPALGAPAFR
jgi:hypothetical protein